MEVQSLLGLLLGDMPGWLGPGARSKSSGWLTAVLQVPRPLCARHCLQTVGAVRYQVDWHASTTDLPSSMCLNNCRQQRGCQPGYISRVP